MIGKGDFMNLVEPQILQSIVNASGEYIILLDAEGYIQVSNIQRSLVFHTDSSTKGMHIDQFRQSFQEQMKNPIQIEALFEKYATMKERYSEVLETVNGDGFFMVKINPIWSQDSGDRIGTLVVVSDVTEMKKLEIELHSYAENLEGMIEERTKEIRKKDAVLAQSGKMATLGEMATGIAHEINQPLYSISLIVQGLKKAQDKGKLTDGLLMPKLEDVESQIQRISKIILHLKNFSRSSTGVLEKVCMNASIRDIFKMMKEHLQLKNISVVFHLDEALPLVMAEYVPLEQVFINLTTNARDAMEDYESKHPDICRQKQIGYHTYKEGEYVIAEVEDTGGGVPEEIQDKLFEPFFTTKEVGKGTGIGLAISYGIIKSFQGDIDFKTILGEGTLFRIRIPIAGQDKEHSS